MYSKVVLECPRAQNSFCTGGGLCGALRLFWGVLLPEAVFALGDVFLGVLGFSKMFSSLEQFANWRNGFLCCSEMIWGCSTVFSVPDYFLH